MKSGAWILGHGVQGMVNGDLRELVERWGDRKLREKNANRQAALLFKSGQDLLQTWRVIFKYLRIPLEVGVQEKRPFQAAWSWESRSVRAYMRACVREWKSTSAAAIHRVKTPFKTHHHAETRQDVRPPRTNLTNLTKALFVVRYLLSFRWTAAGICLECRPTKATDRKIERNIGRHTPGSEILPHAPPADSPDPHWHTRYPNRERGKQRSSQETQIITDANNESPPKQSEENGNKTKERR